MAFRDIDQKEEAMQALTTAVRLFKTTGEEYQATVVQEALAELQQTLNLGEQP